MAYIAPSVTTYYGLNPGYRTYSVQQSNKVKICSKFYCLFVFFVLFPLNVLLFFECFYKNFFLFVCFLLKNCVYLRH